MSRVREQVVRKPGSQRRTAVAVAVEAMEGRRMLSGDGIDLVAGSVGLYSAITPGPYVPGGTIQVDASASTTEQWTRLVGVRYALSADDVAGNADDVVLGEWETAAAGTDPSLPVCPGLGHSVTIPAGTLPGAYRLVAIIDPEKQITETDEGNNTVVGSVVKVEAASDYLGAWSVTGVELGPEEVKAGGKLVVQSVDLAAGPHPDNGIPFVTVDFALSRDGVVGNEDDIRLGGRVYPAVAGKVEFPWETPVRSTVAAGTYRLVGKVTGVDGKGGVYAPYGTFVGPEVEVKELGPVDLTPLAPVVATYRTPGPFASGDSISVWVGAQTTTYEHRAVDVRVSLSADDVAGNEDDIVLGVLPTIAEGDASPSVDLGAQWLTIPAGVVTGQYHLVAMLDPANEVEEADEGNNAIVGPTIWVREAGGSVEQPSGPADVIPPPDSTPLPAPARPHVDSGSTVDDSSPTPAVVDRPAPKLVGKVVAVRKAGRVVHVVRVINRGTAAYRGVAKVRVVGVGVVKRKVRLGVGMHADLAVLAKAVKPKAVRLAVL